jgi:hypothetical protein
MYRSMEDYIFSKIAKECLQDKLYIPLQPREELSIHFIKNNKVYFQVILYKEDTEYILSYDHPYYHEEWLEYLYLFFQIETENIIQMHLILDYDREQETFIHSIQEFK